MKECRMNVYERTGEKNQKERERRESEKKTQ